MKEAETHDQPIDTKATKSESVKISPMTFFLRKWLVFGTSGIMIYSGYMYIVHLCAVIIQNDEDQVWSKKTGYGLLATFSLFYACMLWAYAKVVFTPPGYARDHIAKTPRPPHPPYFQMNRARSSEEVVVKDVSTLLQHDTSATLRYRSSQHGRSQPSATPADPAQERELRRLRAIRQPSTTPALNPAYRYCSVDGLVKPARTHHCQDCETCILKYSHHCDWIGQCLGARNYKYFINFLFLTIICTSYTFITLVSFAVLSKRSYNVNSINENNPHRIAGIIITAFFCLFTCFLFTRHVRNMLHGQTLVERMYIMRSQDKEEEALSKEYRWWDRSAKRRIREEWEKDWGGPETEGNIWWRGSKREEWADVMGEHWVGWLLPVGKSRSDGLEYPVNPRFDEDGLLRRRAQWPEELR